MRTHWRGLSGGDDVWREIDAFFTRLEQRALPMPARPVPDVTLQDLSAEVHHA
jgi:hypothetical protein